MVSQALSEDKLPQAGAVHHPSGGWGERSTWYRMLEPFSDIFQQIHLLDKVLKPIPQIIDFDEEPSACFVHSPNNHQDDYTSCCQETQ
jgi:hypothetical protein